MKTLLLASSNLSLEILRHDNDGL